MLEVFKKVFNLDFYGQVTAPVNPPAGSARMFYDSATDAIVVIDSTGKNLLASGTFAGTRAIAEVQVASVIDFYGQQAAPENPSTGLARAYYDSVTDDFAVIDSQGTVLLGTGSSLSGHEVEVSGKVHILDFLGLTSAPSNPPAGFARMYYNSQAGTFNVIDSTGKSLLSQAPPSGITFLAASTTEINNADGPASSAGIDTTGADLLVVVTGSFFGGESFTDSYNNSWTSLTTYSGNATYAFTTIHYCVSPTVGAGHTITVQGGTQCNAVFAAFSGAAQTDVVEAGTDKGASTFPLTAETVQPGNVTPLQVGDLILTGVSGVADSEDDVACDSGFTVIQQSTTDRWEVALAYLIATDTTATNPTWDNMDGGGGNYATSSIAVFSVV